MEFVGSIRSSAIASQFFERFKSIFPEFELTLMGEWEPLKKKFDLSEACIEWERNRGGTEADYGHHIFYGRKPAPFYVLTNWHGKGTHKRWHDAIAVMFDQDLWRERKISDMSQRAMALLRELSLLSASLYGKIFTRSEF